MGLRNLFRTRWIGDNPISWEECWRCNGAGYLTLRPGVGYVPAFRIDGNTTECNICGAYKFVPVSRRAEGEVEMRNG